ncbi:MAG: dprA [Bacillales bacterium]|jgi:DNA processing protein|nr:dprA [Bacillales bacterium]
MIIVDFLSIKILSIYFRKEPQMQTWKQRLVHLDHCRGAGWQVLYQILKDDPELKLLYSWPETYWQRIFNHPSQNLASFLNDLLNPFLHNTYEYVLQSNIKVLTILDEEYPESLKEIHQPPWILYCKGDTRLLNEETILAVIGTRKPTTYGIQVTNHLIPEIIQAGIPIVSGLAKGIDSHAQWQALHAGGKVIGVIGSGFHKMYPQENQHLADEISQKGLLITEYPPNMPPQKHHFPARNRIISGLSKSILVIEGKKRSGTFITVEQGLNHGKDIFAVPGSLFSPESEGPNELIRQGARVIQHAKDILEEWGIK